jgi:hypothetical protein
MEKGDGGAAAFADRVGFTDVHGPGERVQLQPVRGVFGAGGAGVHGDADLFLHFSFLVPADHPRAGADDATIFGGVQNRDDRNAAAEH